MDMLTVFISIATFVTLFIFGALNIVIKIIELSK